MEIDLNSIICLFELVFCCYYAEKILPVVRNQHLLLCTLLICNAAAMEVPLLKACLNSFI